MYHETISALDMQLNAILEKRKQAGTLRTLQITELSNTDFISNDYLGLARSTKLHDIIRKRKAKLKVPISRVGATGSRLISGNTAYCMALEQKLAKFYNSESALLFNCGYAANTGILSSLPQKSDIIIYDELVHASANEGIRLCRAMHAMTFKHNDISDLSQKLNAAFHQIDTKLPIETVSNVYVVIESLYSMDGDLAPLKEIVDICRKASLHRRKIKQHNGNEMMERRTNVFVIVDEAHSTGLYGPNGSGYTRELGLEASAKDVIVARIMTFGKAMGTHGAVVCGSKSLINFLVNYARPFMYSTSMPWDQLVTIDCAHDVIASHTFNQRRADLKQKIRYFQLKIDMSKWIPSSYYLNSSSPIQLLLFPGTAAILEATKQLRTLGTSVVPIRAPTVPSGLERFRIIIHAHNTQDEIDILVKHLDTIYGRYRDTIKTNALNELKSDLVSSKL